MSSLLPLFPLEAVLLPGVPFPLHIFEPRYKEMIEECLAEQTPFGVVRSQDEGVSEIGCTAEILAVTKKHPDGKLDIVTQGKRRFEVLEVNQERSFLRAEVLYIDDEGAQPTQAEVEHALKLHVNHDRVFGFRGALILPDTHRQVEIDACVVGTGGIDGVRRELLKGSPVSKFNVGIKQRHFLSEMKGFFLLLG